MKKTKRPLWAWMVALVMAVLLMTSSAMNVQAAEPGAVDDAVVAGEMAAEEMLQSIFSLEYYAEHNPDVVAVYGYNYDALYHHYIGCGIHEGRDVSPIVNLRLYRDCNSDLLDAYGDDWMGVLLHFTEKGINEVATGLRQPMGVRFDPVAYMAEHPDMELLTSSDMLKVAELFIYEGMPEGDWITTEVVAEVESVVVSNTMMAASTFAVVEQPAEDSSRSDDSSSNEEASQPTETTPSTPDEPTPEEPVPSCDHASVFCGEKCDVCGAVIGHDFGESGTDPYCSKCNASYVQVNGCSHPEWNGGACVYCKKVDLYYQQHDSYHVDESCPDCGYQGTLLYSEDECPGHEYDGNGICKKCNGEKEETVTPPEVTEDPKEEVDNNGGKTDVVDDNTDTEDGSNDEVPSEPGAMNDSVDKVNGTNDTE